MLRRGTLTADRLRKAANSARGRCRKARGQRVLNVTVHFRRASEWLYGEGPGGIIKGIGGWSRGTVPGLADSNV
jgi:hypothetical protein